jgi:isopentenyl-diphosphate delta-isomerase
MTANLEFSFSFLYKFEFENGLTEHEFDHVYIGKTDLLPQINANEVNDWKYMSIPNLENEILEKPQLYTPWLKICLPQLKQNLSFI